MKPNPQQPKRITFRLPAELARKVDAIKSRERRSLNTQLVILIERGLAA